MTNNARSRWARLRHSMFLGFVGTSVAMASALIGIAVVVAYQVYFSDDAELKRSTILARINEETSIYTLDEQTRVGSFFDASHRRYVSIDEIPPHVIRAMVASEDKNFYNHVGIDPTAIFLAFTEGIANGMKFRRGGSTITQQTVKNILDRREHSFKRKFKEGVRALQLETMYSKREILEFYLNQFHVTANGNGIAIAAQYYFSKDVKDLDLVEGAFIAGSVKAPSKYNPFSKYTKKDQETAANEADQRKNYVLRRMYEQGWVTKAELEKSWNLHVPFKKGKFHTEEVALVSLIKGQMNRKEILDALNMESPEELNHAGLKVFSTLDWDMQQEAQLMMRRNLSRLEHILKGFKPAPAEEFKALRTLEVNQFYYGKVESITMGKEPFIMVDFGLPKGVIPYESLVRTAKILSLPTYQPFEKHLAEILKVLKKDDVIFAEVKEYEPETHRAVLELKSFPSVNGGLIAVDKGEVRAVVAGFDAKGYNRAVFATRQPGSVFKSVVYFAALQLGWSIIDRIDNQRRLFPFQGKFYYPRPDHVSPYSEVSMLWAGTKSENLASVFLTATLLSKLSFNDFKALMESMGLGPTEGEAPRDFHFRVAKATGVQLDNEGVREHLLEEAIQGLTPDLVFGGNQELLRKLDKMWWGRGYVSELHNVYTAGGEIMTPTEKNIRVDLAKNNFLRFGTLAAQVGDDWNAIAKKVEELGPDAAFKDSGISAILERFHVLSGASARPNLAYVRTLPEEDPRPSREGAFVPDAAAGRALNALDVQAIWGAPGLFSDKANIGVGDVRLNGYLPLGLFQKIQAGIEELYSGLAKEEDTYDRYRYFNHHDFRIILGLKYLVNLSRAMGVYSPLEPVLSFPLGTNDVSVAEVAKIYQTFTEGKIYRFFKEGSPNQLNFIRRIEDRSGNILYQAEREEVQLTPPCFAAQMSEILRKVVTHGTGRRANGELFVTIPGTPSTPPVAGAPPLPAGEMPVRIPAYGKTGTTNDYTTAYFAGFVPYPVEANKPLSVTHALTIASYVGYDLNKSMRVGGYRISGAYGALPIWTDFAKAIMLRKKFASLLTQPDSTNLARGEWLVDAHKCTRPVKIDLPRGSVLRVAEAGDSEAAALTNIEKEGEAVFDEFSPSSSIRSVVRLATVISEGVRTPLRRFIPFNLNGSAEEAVNGDLSGAGNDLDAPIDGKVLAPEGEAGPEATAEPSLISPAPAPAPAEPVVPKAAPPAKVVVPASTEKPSAGGEKPLW